MSKNKLDMQIEKCHELLAELTAAKEHIERMKLALDSSNVTKAALRERIAGLEAQIEEMYTARDNVGAELAAAREIIECRHDHD